MSIFHTMSKVYERLIYNQLYPYFDKFFSKFQYDFRKAFNSHRCLVTMTEKWQSSVYESGQGVLF